MSVADILFKRNMENASASEKTAMPKDERMKYLKAAILAGIGAAGIGAFVRDSKAKKARESAMDVANAKNSIVVHIKKKKFMEGLPTPSELSQARGEDPSVSNGPALIENKAPVASLPPPVQTPATASVDMSSDDIEARKKAILGGKRFNFFGKRASDDESEKKDKDKDSVEIIEDAKDKGSKEEKKDGEKGHVFLRDQNGKFVSPTDPVGVEQAEKEAQITGVSDLFFHPVDSLSRTYEAAKGKPVLFAAGAVGSIYIASKISEAIREARRKKSKELLDKARDEYVGILESENEKAAEFDIRDAGGIAFGSALLVPMALTAMVTNKIIENRKAEKRKAKEVSDSYPDEPLILYKTSEGKDVAITPESALAAIMTKTAMLYQAELSAASDSLKKNAAFTFNPTNMDDTVNFAIDEMFKPQNEKSLLNIASAFGTPDFEKVVNREQAAIEQNANKFVAAPHYFNLKSPKFINALLSSKRFQDDMTAKVINAPDNSAWGKFRTNKINETLGTYLRPGSLIYKIVEWITHNTGLGKYFARRYADDAFAPYRQQAATAPAQGVK